MVEVRKYDLGVGVYENVNVLVNDINNLPDFEAEMNNLGGSKDIASNLLDEVDTENIKGRRATITAVAGDLINRTRNDKYIQIEVDFKKGIPEELELQNLKGGETSPAPASWRSEEHTSELQSRFDLVCRLLLEKKKKWT